MGMLYKGNIFVYLSFIIY